MHHIHTSPEAVSKLKKAAKLLTRGDTLLQHAEALDRVAKDAGYLHWKHVTTCAGTSVAQGTSPLLASLTAAQCTDPRFGKPNDQELILIVGPSGYGKTFRAIDLALNALRQGRRVHILDIGGNYWHLCHALRGSYNTFDRNGMRLIDDNRLNEKDDDTHLIVFELGGLLEQPEATRTSVPVHEIDPTALLIVDETWEMPRALGSPDALRYLVEAHLEAGGSAVLLNQDRILPNRPLPFIDIKSGPSVRRSLVLLDRI